MTDAETKDAAPEPAGPKPSEGGEAYRVLARKYRPQNFAELVGQNALVRTLTNAIERDRIAHAFVLTGVRGIGKTTTARILARALNCIGPDGKGGPTIAPCGECEHCIAIAEDRHMDVIEMDAASHTGVDNMRELIESARYRPTSARFKLYIIDEVHMLSASAFNALLKTLEEPPEHVKFVLATTEIRKVPVTVLSRCQRFDLKRLDHETLTAHLTNVAGQEKAAVDEGAMAMIVRAADGSVRDGLSLLDQAIALGDHEGSDTGGSVAAETVRDMLGLADQARILDLFDLLMGGKIAEALALAGELYRSGADPVVIVQDLLDLSHWLTRLKIVSEAAEGLAVSEAERARAAEMAGKLAMPALSRVWQMLLKGLAEVQTAHAPLTALEMALIRLAYAAELPTPGEIVAALGDDKSEDSASETEPASALAPKPAETQTAAPPSPATPPTPISPTPPSPTPPSPTPAIKAAAGGGESRPAPMLESENPDPDAQPRALHETPPELGEVTPEPATIAPIEPPAPSETPAPATTLPNPGSFTDVVELFRSKREATLYGELKTRVHLVSFAAGRIEIRPTEGASETLANRIGSLLTEWTGTRWVVSVSREPGDPTLSEQEAAADAARREKAAQHPLVRAALDTFPGARIEAVRDLPAPTGEIPDDETSEDSDA